MPLYRLEPMEKKEWRNYQRFYKGDDFEFTTVELYRFGYVTIEHDGDMQNFFESYCDGLFEIKEGDFKSNKTILLVPEERVYLYREPTWKSIINKNYCFRLHPL